MNAIAYRATIINIAGNTLLFILKIVAGVMSGSIALISDALNSFTDIISSVAVFICVRISGKEADEGHPFGHSRAEPIAGLIVAILAGILGFEIIRSSFERLYHSPDIDITTFTLIVPLITIIIKALMAWYFKRVGEEVNSPAIRASSIDSICDVVVSVAALVGILGVLAGLPILDPIAGFIISLWIIYTGYKIGMENVDYLMGKAPPDELLEEIKEAACNVGGVRDINTVRAHYVGNFIHVEIHVEVDKKLSTEVSHAIGEEVEANLDRISAIDKSFVHIDPV
jgi:cation diffusion facilitator family transporter